MPAGSLPQTKDRLIEAALECFAERGFHGASIALIADALGLTKQALLHHFGTKEKLYGEVLARVSCRYLELIAELEASEASAENKLERFFEAMHLEVTQRSDESRLLVRELLDNKRRAEKAERWFLKGFLDRLVALIRSTERWATASEAEAFAVLYQLLGAVVYFSISEPTVSRMYGKKGYLARRKTFPEVLRTLTRSVLRSP